MLAFAEWRSMMPTDRALKLLVISAMLSSVLGLAACGGGGGGYGSGGGGGSAGTAAPSKLFGADSPHRMIGSLANPNPGAGTIPLDPVIGGGFYHRRFPSNNRRRALGPAPHLLS